MKEYVRAVLAVIAAVFGFAISTGLDGALHDAPRLGVATDAFATEPLPPPPGGPAADMRAALQRVFDKQQRNGEIAFDASDSLFYRHPVMATLSLEAFRRTRDLAFLQRAHGALKGYFNYLLVYHDADKDFLIERSSFSGPDAAGDLEDVGFNTLLALDMLNLSQICLELGMPVDALFWYRGMRVVSERLVKSTYDPGALLFLPTRASRAGTDNVVYGLSVLPVYFATELGDEIPLQVIRHNMLGTKSTSADAPARYLSWDFSPAERETAPYSARLLRAILLLGALEWNGLGAEASRFAQGVVPKMLAEAAAAPAAGQEDFSRYLAGVVESGGPFAWFPRFHDLAVLDQLVFRKSLLAPDEIAALRRSSAAIQQFLIARTGSFDPVAHPQAPSVQTGSVDADIRQLYFSISLLREKWKQRSLFSDADRSVVTGFDVYAAVSELIDDVIATLQCAENFQVDDRWRSSGFDLAVTLEKTSVGPGDPVPFALAVSASSSPVRIRSITVLRQQVVDTVMSAPSPIVVSPGDPPREYAYSHPAPRGSESTLVPLALTVETRFDDGRRERRHYRKGIFITRPVTCAVRFPNGTTLINGSVPVEILVTKHLAADAKIQAQWYSPAGLKPAEGRSVEALMPRQTKEASVLLNILVPNPCRPGSFPFTLKVFVDGKEAGTISSKLFKHYEWLFVGPFPGKREALDVRYPPEAQLNLFDSYTGALGRLGWQTLSAKAYVDDGRLSLESLLPEGSVGFLYTVIETAAPRASTVLFESAAPAVLYLNGEAVARTAGGSSRQRVDVSLKGGMNNVLVKTHATTSARVFFQLGDEEDLMSDEFNNNLWELVDGYQELLARGHERGRDEEKIQRRVTITFRDPVASSVAVVGSFNGWSPANTAMRKNNYGEWEIGLYLAPGRYTYRFIVNDNTEVVDPASPYTEPDGYGGQNSVLYVQ